MDDLYYGLPTRSLANPYLRVDFLTTAGPRLVRLQLADSTENLLAETPNAKWETPYGEFHLYGGHRFWYAPEVFPQTSFPDNQPIRIEELPNGVRLTEPTESASGLTKRLELHLAPDSAELTLIHHLQNDGARTPEVAPWGITELPLGGVALLPQRVDTNGYGPNRQLALWSYSHWTDTRLELRDDWIRVHAQSQPTPLKIGYFDSHGWLAYLNREVLFVKRFQPLPGRSYPDLNCNAEVYVNDRYIELETLALQVVEGGQVVVEHDVGAALRRR